MIRRLQTILVVLWALLVLLLGLFNWTRVWEPEPVELLFMEFEWPWIAWLLLGSLGALVVLRLLTWIELRLAGGRLEREMNRLKAAAFDERGREMEQLATTIQEKVEATLRQRDTAGPTGGGAPADGD